MKQAPSTGKHFKLKILVVDDSRTAQLVMCGSLEDLGFTNITCAKDGTEAWDKIKKENFQLIISDWNMPEMSGLDLLKRVRGDATTKDLPFLLVTTNAEKEYVTQAVNEGVSNYIVKPYTHEVLQRKLNSVLLDLEVI